MKTVTTTPVVHILHLVKLVNHFGEGIVHEYVGHTLILGIESDDEFQRIYSEYFDCFNAEGFEVLHSTCNEDALDYDCDLEHMQNVDDLDEDNPFLLDKDDCQYVWHVLNNHKYGQRPTFDESVWAMWDAYEGVNLAFVRGNNI